MPRADSVSAFRPAVQGRSFRAFSGRKELRQTVRVPGRPGPPRRLSTRATRNRSCPVSLPAIAILRSRHPPAGPEVWLLHRPLEFSLMPGLPSCAPDHRCGPIAAGNKEPELAFILSSSPILCDGLAEQRQAEMLGRYEARRESHGPSRAMRVSGDWTSEL